MQRLTLTPAAGSSLHAALSGHYAFAGIFSRGIRMRTFDTKRCVRTGQREVEATMATCGELSSTSSCFKAFSQSFAIPRHFMSRSTLSRTKSSGWTSLELSLGPSVLYLKWSATSSLLTILQTKLQERKSSSTKVFGASPVTQITSAKLSCGGVFTS